MSTINVTNLSGRGGGTPNLPDGAVISGVATITNLKPTNVNVSGAITATTFDGSLKSTGTPTLGLGVTINSSGVKVSGVLTATTLYGDGSNLTGVGDTIAPHYYNPDVNAPKAPVATGIGITFNKKVVAGSGTATLKIVNAGAAGTTIQSWGVSSCTFGVTDVTFGSLVSDLIINQTYQVDIPATFIDDSAGSSYVGTAWTFTSQPASSYLFAWGHNQVGQLGQSQTVPHKRSSPVQIPGQTWSNFTGDYLNSKHSILTKNDGSLWSWGSNENGELGLSSKDDDRSSPVKIGSGTDWANASNAHLASYAIKTDGTFWAFGSNAQGNLGQSSTIYYSSPTQIPGTTWSKVSGGYTHVAAVKTDGTLWTWGQGNLGALGVPSLGQASRSSPIQVPGTTWRSVSTGNHSTYATKTNGTLWAWGYNASGQLGDNNVTSNSSPVQIPGTSWSALVNAGYYQAYATKTDGTFWSWGQNNYGSLGQNVNGTPGTRSSPVQVPGTTWPTTQGMLSSGNYANIAVKTDGTMWGWGLNHQGQLGQNSKTYYSSPIQIPGTLWQSCSLNTETAFATQEDTTP